MTTRTNIVLDDELIAQAMVRAGVRTKKAAVEAALRAYVRQPDYSGLLALEGSGVLADDYDPAELFIAPREGWGVHHVAEPAAPPYPAKQPPRAKGRG
ncbi:type II toxin-antitoxin system VapB family antitoxin [Ottowia sp.]|uniref:type II toxin-antitoxin system VapB family antitoxin n=1 Tax=Ottowia sp. TaxID=1898956 RepID=UPI002BA67870|nr:type II toxin-antitoxin system VapB family antitoxin [Ottowia sp.]HOB67939.1 type II toxin-antitoxin system VapB family antitoxin [Ottowia sp.]HPZ58249.1 type II toxin-antitoxin system VapB family antitoxin [Ottowia sp.]HQD49141.1 type II toxin-antitoxin system VapB family antitoxin [Ottowia sp.]